jgi:hypothetical protein
VVPWKIFMLTSAPRYCGTYAEHEPGVLHVLGESGACVANFAFSRDNKTVVVRNESIVVYDVESG